MRKQIPTPLVLAALVLIAVAVAVGLGAGSALSPEPSAERGAEAEKRPALRREAAPDPALEPAARYALAARNWTPATYTRSWERQLVLAAGRYRRELAGRRPARAELAALRADASSSAARLVRAERDPRVVDPRARVLVTLQERTQATGQQIDGETVNEVKLRRLGARWRVVGWSVLPGGGAG